LNSFSSAAFDDQSSYRNEIEINCSAAAVATVTKATAKILRA
jgi:hypothetical protein